MAITQTWVIVKSGERTISRYLLGLGEHMIGRGADCSILVDAEPVSRHHARLTIGPDGVILEDLGSTNGTYVDHTRVEGIVTLQRQQRIRIGNLELEMIASTDEEFVPTGEHKVFISHAAQDKSIADALCATLEFRNIPCWVAPRDVLPGQDWGTAIIEAINKSRIMIVVFSSHSNNSEHVKREIQNAISAGATVIPLRIEEIPLSPALKYFLGTCHWLDAITPPMEKHLSHLAETVRVLLERGPNPQPMPPTLTGVSHEKRIFRKTLMGVAVIAVLLLAAVAFLLNHAEARREQRAGIPSEHTDLDTIRAELKALLASGSAGIFAEQLKVIEAKIATLEGSRQPDKQSAIDQLAKELAGLTVGPPAGRPFENSLGMKFVPVPGAGVLFSVWDTRVKDFAAFVNDRVHNGGYDYRKGTAPHVWTPADGWGTQAWQYDWQNPGFAQTPEHPVVCTSWEDARAFCEWLTAKERREGKISSQHRYSLPTDVEWSAAVGIGRLEGGGTPSEKNGRVKDAYPWGTQWPPPKGAGNYSSLFQADDYDLGTAPVGSFATNQYGLCDMGGNVGQWCEDWWDTSRKEHVFRGLSWGGAFADVASASGCLLSSSRYAAAPDFRDNFNGFRVVLVGGGRPSPSHSVSAEVFAKEVAALPPELQFERVMERLEQLNPGLRNVKRYTSYRSQDGKVTELELCAYDSTMTNTVAQALVDISPIRALVGLKRLKIGQADKPAILTDLSLLNGMQLDVLDIWSASNLADLRPLRGMPLTSLSVCGSSVSDLSPLQGMRLTSLWIGNTRVKDLAPLNSMPLRELGCWGTGVSDLAPLRTMQLTYVDLNGSSNIVDITPLKDIPLGGLRIGGTQVKDLSPLKGMPLTLLHCWETPVHDLAPLRGMPLADLNVGRTRVEDLTTLKDLPLVTLDIGGTRVKDLAPLRGLLLRRFYCGGTAVRDLTPLAGMPLTELNVNDTQVVDLAPLQGMRLTGLWIGNTRVKDLAPLKGMPLTGLGCWESAVSDLTPLKGMPLTWLNLNGSAQVSDLGPLKGMPLVNLQCWGVKGLSDLAPLRGMPLKILSCSDSSVRDLSPLREMRLEQLYIPATKVDDLSPLKGMPLTTLHCWQTPVHDLAPLTGMPLTDLNIKGTQVVDLTPLKGMPLVVLECWCSISDLSPLRGMPLTKLACGHSAVSDLSPLRDMRLVSLHIPDTQVKDLSPLKGVPLTELDIHGTRIRNLSPLRGMPLKRLWCDVNPKHRPKILSSIKTLERINDQPVVEFWKKVNETK